MRYPFLDFSTVGSREHNAREELRLNRRLAPRVYLGLLALRWEDGVFSLQPDDRPEGGRSWTGWWPCSGCRLRACSTRRSG